MLDDGDDDDDDDSPGLFEFDVRRLRMPSLQSSSATVRRKASHNRDETLGSDPLAAKALDTEDDIEEESALSSTDDATGQGATRQSQQQRSGRIWKCDGQRLGSRGGAGGLLVGDDDGDDVGDSGGGGVDDFSTPPALGRICSCTPKQRLFDDSRPVVVDPLAAAAYRQAIVDTNSRPIVDEVDDDADDHDSDHGDSIDDGIVDSPPWSPMASGIRASLATASCRSASMQVSPRVEVGRSSHCKLAAEEDKVEEMEMDGDSDDEEAEELSEEEQDSFVVMQRRPFAGPCLSVRGTTCAERLARGWNLLLPPSSLLPCVSVRRGAASCSILRDCPFFCSA